MSIKLNNDPLLHSLLKSNAQSLGDIKSSYITSIPYKHEKKVTNVEDFSLLIQKEEGMKKDTLKPLQNNNLLSQFEYNKLILIHKGKRDKLSFDTEFIDNKISFSQKKEMLKIGIKARKKKKLFLPTLNSSILKIHSQKNIFKTPINNHSNYSKVKLDIYREISCREKKGIMRRSPGNGVCVKLNIYKKNRQKQMPSLVNILNNKDFMSQIMKEKRNCFNSDHLISPIHSYERNKSNNTNDESDNLSSFFSAKINRNKLIGKPHNQNSNGTQPTNLNLSKSNIDKPNYHISKSVKHLLLDKVKKKRTIIVRNHDKEVMKALHNADLDHLKIIIDPSSIIFSD